MTRGEFIASVGEGVATITDQNVIAAAWGNRRVSSRCTDKNVKAYPENVTAHASLWLEWYDRVAADPDFVSIVIDKKPAQARIDEALGISQLETDEAAKEPVATLTQEEIADLEAERAELRAARLFEDADKIRDFLTLHAVVVADGKVLD